MAWLLYDYAYQLFEDDFPAMFGADHMVITGGHLQQLTQNEAVGLARDCRQRDGGRGGKEGGREKSLTKMSGINFPAVPSSCLGHTHMEHT